MLARSGVITGDAENGVKICTHPPDLEAPYCLESSYEDRDNLIGCVRTSKAFMLKAHTEEVGPCRSVTASLELGWVRVCRY